MKFLGNCGMVKRKLEAGGLAVSVHESGEMYLEAVLVLQQKSGFVRSVDVAEYLGYSKPSVSRAMGILRREGYLTIEENGGIILTEKGRSVAEMIYERHTVLTQMLLRLGVPEPIAVHDACKIEHDISPETFSAIKQHMAEQGQ